MKPYSLYISVIIFLLFYTSGLKAQTTQTKLDQVQLMKQFLGNWKAELSKDTVAILECKPLYNGFDFYYKTKTKGKTIFEERTFTGYDEKSDKLIKVFFSDSKPEFGILTLWFTKATVCEEIFFENIPNPDKAELKWIFEFKRPNLLVWSFIKNGKIVNSDTWTRVK